jgi:hypothetical protein
MQAVVSRWPSEAELLRERWFRGGPRSALWVGRVTGAAGVARFRWRYHWMDMGMHWKREKRVFIMQMARNCYVVNRRVLCDLEGLESACFRGAWGECEAQALRELGISTV